MTHEQFRELLAAVAKGWRAGDALRAASCFTLDAVYLEPPDGQRYRGRDELYAFFGGESPPAMSMQWHHVVFDEMQQVGVGEYTFQGRRRYHGLVLIHCRDGLISHWREYQ
jgi:ketosteroid isomerase-like protein